MKNSVMVSHPECCIVNEFTKNVLPWQSKHFSQFPSKVLAVNESLQLWHFCCYRLPFFSKHPCMLLLTSLLLLGESLLLLALLLFLTILLLLASLLLLPCLRCWVLHCCYFIFDKFQRFAHHFNEKCITNPRLFSKSKSD